MKKFVRINGINTRYYIGGGRNRPHLLFLHGWAASSRMWLRSMWALRDRFRTWAIDLPGFGDSDSPASDWYTVDAYTDHVAALCEELRIQPFAVVGHSMGGRITLDLARRYPHLLQQMVLVSPTITGRLGFNLDIFLTAPFGRPLMQVSHRVWPLATAGVMSTYWAPRFLGTEGMKRTVMDLQRSSPEAAIGALRALTSQDYSMHLREIQQPALVICGERDYTIPPDDSRMAASHLPGGQLIMLGKVHHWPTDEVTGRFNAILRDYLIQRQPLAEFAA